MSQLTFSPALDTGNTQVVDIPPSAKDGGVKLLLRTRFGSADALAQLKREGIQVQAWTHAPVDGRAQGKWAAYTFEERPIAKKAEDGALELPLYAQETVEDIEPHTLFLALHLRALPHDQAEATFALTYRLLYPNGHIKWLGSYGRDLRVVLRRRDPWIAAPPAGASDPGAEVRAFGKVAMKGAWGCWAIGDSSVRYYPQGVDTETDAALLIFVPSRRPTTFALHQPIILHGKGLRLGASGEVTYRAPIPTRVYTAITSERELAAALPALGLHWHGIHNSHAVIASPPHQHPITVHAIPLLTSSPTSGPSTSVELPLHVLGLPKDEEPSPSGGLRYIVHGPATGRTVIPSGASDLVRLSVGPQGGTCVVSPLYTIDENSALHVDAVGTALLTPHMLVVPVPEKEEVAAVKLEYDSDGEDDFLNHEIVSPMTAPTRAAPADPARILTFLFPLLWRSLAMLFRTVFLRMLLFFGAPLSFAVFPPPKEGAEHSPLTTEYTKGIESDDEADSEPGVAHSLADSHTEVGSAAASEKYALARPSRAFDVPAGPLILLAAAKDCAPEIEAVLDGQRLDLRDGPLSDGLVFLKSVGDIPAGRVEIFAALPRQTQTAEVL